MPYTEQYVAFVDILGFSEIVRKTARDSTPTRYDALVTALTQIGAFKVKFATANLGFKFQTFSDSIVLSADASFGGLAFLLLAIQKFAVDLLKNGLLMRGAIAKGKLHHENGVMFGPAFLEAYHIETSIAKYPRVVLSREVYEDYQSDEERFPQILLAEDGPPYLHVLDFLSTSGDQLVTAQLCQQVIQKLLDESIHDPGHYEKLRWLAIYWNLTVGTADGPLTRIVFPIARNLEQKA